MVSRRQLAALPTKSVRPAPMPMLPTSPHPEGAPGGWHSPGIEYTFAPHWTAKIEYNYVDLGKNTENFNVIASPATLTFREDIEHTVNIRSSASTTGSFRRKN